MDSKIHGFKERVKFFAIQVSSPPLIPPKEENSSLGETGEGTIYKNL